MMERRDALQGHGMGGIAEDRHLRLTMPEPGTHGDGERDRKGGRPVGGGSGNSIDWGVRRETRCSCWRW